jgi:transposase
MDTKKSVRRKIWSEALKREIVAAASVPGASVSVIARRYNVNTNLVFTWRRQFVSGTTKASALRLVLDVLERR